MDRSRNKEGTSVFNAPIIHLSSVGSTNNYAAELIRTGEVAHGTVILADEQTAGKGQRNNSWVSAPGLDLTFTLIVKPHDLAVNKQISLSHLAAISVKEMLRRSGVTAEVGIKWPNDIMVKDRKIAGILIENSLIQDRLEFALVGVGVNIGRNDFPEVLRATSLSMIMERKFVIKNLLDLYLAAFKERYERWCAAGNDFIDLDEHLWKKGIWCDFELDNQDIVSKPLTVSSNGQLVVELGDGTVQAFGTERLKQKR